MIRPAVCQPLAWSTDRKLNQNFASRCQEALRNISGHKEQNVLEELIYIYMIETTFLTIATSGVVF